MKTIKKNEKFNFLLLLVLLIVQSCFSDNLDTNVENVFIEFAKPSIEADGFSKNEVEIQLPKELIGGNNTEIELKSSDGKFENNTNTIKIKSYLIDIKNDGNVKRVARTSFFASQKPGEVQLEIRILEKVYEKKLLLTKAYPEQVKVKASTLTISQGFGEVQITSELKRTNGKVSENTSAQTIAVNEVGQQVGLFLNYEEHADLNGMINNKFSLGNNNCNCNSVFIITKTINENSQIISDTLQLIKN